MIYTSNYSTASKLKGNPYFVRISVTQPSWTQTHDSVPTLFPDAQMLWGYKDGRVTDQEYTRRYRIQLERNWEQIASEMKRLAARAQGRPIVLLCWCGKGRFCHRRLFAEWWKEQTGEEIKEI